jgi:Flp pilus assembly protein TadD
MPSWFNSREATQVGTALADEFAPPAGTPGTVPRSSADSLTQLFRRADSQVRSLGLNLFKKAKFANAFKWRLIENGVSREIADDVTQSLVLHLSQSQMPTVNQDSAVAPASRPERAKAQELFNRGNKCFANAAYTAAAAFYEEAVGLDSTHAEAFNNLGSALSQLNRQEEAEQCFLRAIAIKPGYSDPYGNLGILLRSKGNLAGSETALRRAIKLRPNNVEAKINLGLTLAFFGRVRDARSYLAKVLKTAPRKVEALQGMGQLAILEGRFEEAETTFKHILEIDPKMPGAWAALASLRKMSVADANWFSGAQEIATSGIHPLDEANMRFAMGKYCDDVGDFAEAFQNYKRANELLRTSAGDYQREKRTHLVDDLIRVYSRDAISKIQGTSSASARPIFIVGMPRSGTSLAEQIIAAHPAAHGGGELPFWETLVVADKSIRGGILSEQARVKTAEGYLHVLEGLSADALRVTDKTPVNSDFLGLIYSVFPNARVIYMQRDPIDTCLSCYFQQFFTGLNFTLDLSDLVHYYREHQRLMKHWRAVLPPGFILDVPYEELVSDQESWSRKMLRFIGLEWDDRCLEFYKNERQVTTASAWQARQKIYKNSVARWRNYEKFIGPLKTLRK